MMLPLFFGRECHIVSIQSRQIRFIISGNRKHHLLKLYWYRFQILVPLIDFPKKVSSTRWDNNKIRRFILTLLKRKLYSAVPPDMHRCKQTTNHSLHTNQISCFFIIPSQSNHFPTPCIHSITRQHEQPKLTL